MKKATIMAFLLVALAPVMQVWAGSTYYYKMHLKVSTNSAGKGLVYAKENTTELPSGATFVTETTVTHSRYDNQSVNTGAAFAKANYGYVFKGWSSTDNSKTYVSTDNPYTPVVSSSATSSNKASTSHFYAVFEDNPNSYTLTLNNPKGLGHYTVTAPSGFTSDLSHGGSATVYKGDKYTISYTKSSEEYDFINWTVNGEQETTDAVSVTISANTTINLTLKKKTTYHATCQASIGGTYKANNNTVSGSDHDEAGFGSVTVSLSNPVAASSEYTFYGWYKIHSNGVKEYLSYYTSASTGEQKENVVIGAEFRRKADVTLKFQPTDGIAYTVAGSETVDGDVYVMDTQAVGSKEVALSISSTIDKQPMWWYKADEFSEKVYFSYDKSVTKTFTASAIVGVDLVHSEKSLAKALEGVESGIVTLTTDSEVLDGTAVTIPAGVEVVVPAGKTLYVDGSLTVNGTLTVNGAVSKCLKIIKQSGEDGLKPINPYGSVKYWKSAKAVSSTASVNNWSGTIGDHLTVMRGDGVAVRGAITSSTKLVKCTFDGTKAINHITGISSVSDSNAIADNSSYVLLANAKITGPKSTVAADKDKSRICNSATIDCAGYNCAMSGTSETLQEISSSNDTKVLNAAAFNYETSYWQNGTARFYNCPSIYIKNVKATPKFHLYDSGSSRLEFTQKDSGTANCYFYSGKFDTDLTGNGPGWITANPNTQIYGGCFKKKPNDKWIDTEVKKTHAFYQHADGYWYLDVNQDTSVAKIGSTPYDTIEDALDYLTENDSATITLLRDVTLNEVYALDAGKSLVVELNGCRINAPNGFVVNSGTLSIRDKDNRLSSAGITVGENANVVENLSEGTVDICYGVYSGNFMNSGTFTTHHGKFTGSIANNGGTMNLNGGMFSSDVSPLLNEGYHAFNYNGLYYVGRFPKPELGASDLGGFAYTLKAMPAADATLYRTKKIYSLESCSNIDEWKYIAELKAAYAIFADDFYFDILGGFDRDIAADTVTATVKISKMAPSEGFPAMTAGNLERLFTPRITQTKISYARFIYDNGEGVYDNLEAAVSDDGSNKGTTCTLAMDLWRWHDSKKKDYIVSYLTILKKSYVFGAGSKKAMLQTASGAVPDGNFFATLAAAVASDTTTGKTIKLCNDCDENVTVGKACTIDTNGFAFTGEITLGEGYSVSFSDGKYVISMPDPADVLVEKVEVATIVEQVVSEEWLVSNEISPDAEPEVIHAAVQEKLKEEDTNGNAKWQNLVLGQATDEKAAVTAANGGTETTATIAVSFEVPKDENGDAIDTGYTVKYAFDKTDSNGTVEGEAQENPTIDFTEVEANEPTYFTMRAVLESNDGNVTNNVPVEKTIGVLKVESDAEYTILAVPWQSLGDGVDGNISAAELVHAASLSENDELIVDNGDGTTTSWFVNKAGEWTAPTTYTEDEQHNLVANEKVEASTVGIARGKGVWLKRSDTTKDIVLIGQPATDDEPVETPIAAATSEDEPTWNLVASPKMEEVDLQTAFTEEKGNTGDEIIVPTAGTPKHYTYKGDKWGYTAVVEEKEVWLPNGEKTISVKFGRKTDDTKVPAGKGFWYLNKGSSDDKKITW